LSDAWYSRKSARAASICAAEVAGMIEYVTPTF